MRRLIRGSAALAGALTLALAVCVAVPPTVDVPLSPQLLARDGTLLHVRPTDAGFFRLPVTPEMVGPQLLDMLFAYEDKRFAAHPGIDPLALGRAIVQTVRQGGVVSGASTLTMQVARLLWRTPHTLAGKLRQMALALRLEAHLSKAEILTLYLHLAPYGGNLEGVRAGSQAWFGKEPQYLTPAEAALLIALPQAPESVRPDRFPERARLARNKVLTRMVTAGVLTQAAATEAATAPLPTRRRAFPASAPHLAARLAGSSSPGSAVPGMTTLDAPLQRRLERWAVRQAGIIPPPASFAVLIADNRTRAVLAYLGSPDALDARRQGAVDMIRAVRSPGSTLKPFIYGLAFDAGVITPETVLNDRPSWFGTYSPTNFSEDFAGEVTAREALQRSLNVPAVLVLDRLGAERGYAALRQTGIPLRYRGDAARPGLPLALGGVGTTLEGLVALYQALATEGKFAPLRYRLAQPTAGGRPFVSAAAARTLMDILADAPLPEGFTRADRRPIAFKTGTSYGFRDAWAIGVSPGYTVGVWTGRADGSPLPGTFGVKSAAPLLFAAFEMLPPESHATAGPAQKQDNTSPRFAFAARPERLTRRAAPLRLVFPRDGMTLKAATLPPQGVPLEVTGGQPPYAWLVNDKPLTHATEQEPLWHPDGAGETVLAVIDGQGRRVSARLWVE